jgi:hypothetical protein
MNPQTVKQLREIAKSRGVRGYYAMRKADLIAALTSPEPTTSAPTTTVIDPFAGFDTWANEQLNKPAVNKATSTSWNDWLTEHVPIPSGFYEWADEQLAKPIKKVASDTFDWIKSKVPNKVKNVINAGFYLFKNKINKIFKKAKQSIFEFKETKSALKGITKQYRVDG